MPEVSGWLSWRQFTTEAWTIHRKFTVEFSPERVLSLLSEPLPFISGRTEPCVDDGGKWCETRTIGVFEDCSECAHVTTFGGTRGAHV